MSKLNTEIWDKYGQLRPLSEIKRGNKRGDIAIIIVNRDRPDLTDALVEQIKGMKTNLKTDTFVVEMGSTERSKYETIYYDDPDYRGKAYGHNVGIRQALLTGTYKYYWILMNDLVFDSEMTIRDLFHIAETNPKIGIMSPTEPTGPYPGCRPVKGKDFHVVSTTDYLSLFIREECIEAGYFLNPSFKYCWGAIHELAHKVNKMGKVVAYCDKVNMKHLGGTTYGKVKSVIPRQQYQNKARLFAARYFVEHYGKDWDDIFTAALPETVKRNTFKLHRDSWQKALNPEEKKLYSKRFGGGDLNSRIKELEPWFYPVIIKDIEVEPGVINGSRTSISDSHLEERTEYRKNIIVDEVVKRYDFKDKSILDVASNCSYWSSHYVKHGATSLTAIEGRYSYVKQGELYWTENQILPKDKFNFIHSNVLDSAMWRKLKNDGKKFDFSLCCGILYHIEDYEMLLSEIDEVTNEAILIDTRVSPDKSTIEEPGGWFFDAIVETKVKRVPTADKIIKFMESKGYAVERLLTDAPLPRLMGSSENYKTGRRVCLLAKRVK